jgi:hypothetical protein
VTRTPWLGRDTLSLTATGLLANGLGLANRGRLTRYSGAEGLARVQMVFSILYYPRTAGDGGDACHGEACGRPCQGMETRPAA